MKKYNLYSFFLILGFFLFFSSCTIQKRTVNKGYFVQWNWNKHISKENIKTSDLADIKAKEQENNSLELASEEAIQTSDNIEIEAVKKENHLASTLAVKKITQVVHPLQKVHQITKEKVSKIKDVFQQKKRVKPAPMDWEQILNIVMLVVFLVLTIVFIMLALKAAGVMLFVYWGLAALCCVLFVTQVIDVILY